MNHDTLDEVLDAVQTAACESGSHVVERTLPLNDAEIPVAGTDADETIALIRAVRPRVVYCADVKFDAAAQVLSDVFGDEADEALLERRRVGLVVSKWRTRDGETAQITAHTMVDGVLHGFILHASWYSDYETDADDLSDEADSLREERVRSARAEKEGRLEPMITKLMRDPRFVGTKVGNAKRLTLAKSLFPDADRRTLDEVVATAEARYWLTATG